MNQDKTQIKPITSSPHSWGSFKRIYKTLVTPLILTRMTNYQIITPKTKLTKFILHLRIRNFQMSKLLLQMTHQGSTILWNNIQLRKGSIKIKLWNHFISSSFHSLYRMETGHHHHNNISSTVLKCRLMSKERRYWPLRATRVVRSLEVQRIRFPSQIGKRYHQLRRKQLQSKTGKETKVPSSHLRRPILALTTKMRFIMRRSSMRHYLIICPYSKTKPMNSTR